MTDLELKANVESELKWEPSVNAAEVGVAAKDGIVTLHGFVQDAWDLLALRRIAKKVAGAKKVVNDVELMLNDQ